MRIIIFGGTAFIGPHVVRGLLRAGHRVTVFHRGKTNTDLPEKVEHIYGELKDVLRYSKRFAKLKPDVVLHMIPSTAQDAWNLVCLFQGVARRVVAVSSVDVYRVFNLLRGEETDSADTTPIREEAPLRRKLYPFRDRPHPDDGDPEQRRRLFDYEKILVERFVMNTPGLPGTVLRLPMVYGPHDPRRRLTEYLKRMDDGRSSILVQDTFAQWRCSRAYVENVATAITCATIDPRAQGRIFNVGEPDALLETEWIKRIGRAAGWEGQIVLLPKADLPKHLRSPYNWAHHWAVDTSRIRKELDLGGEIARSEALQRTVAWDRANPPQNLDSSSFDYEAEDAALSGEAGAKSRPKSAT